MIVEYLRPDSVDEAVQWISRQSPITYPLGGGTVLSQPKNEQYAVVDLQWLGLDEIELKTDIMRIGATTTLQKLLTYSSFFPALQEAIKHEATYNIRQIATIAGTLVAGSSRSPLVTIMLASAALIHFYPDDCVITLGDLLPFQNKKNRGKLITQITISTKIKLAYKYVARTPADLPIVCVSVAQWPTGRTRVVLGGFGISPILVFDGPDDVGAEIAARDAYEEADDSWASGTFRSDIASILVKRCLAEI